jgi:hypothetical protein
MEPWRRWKEGQREEMHELSPPEKNPAGAAVPDINSTRYSKAGMHLLFDVRGA